MLDECVFICSVVFLQGGGGLKGSEGPAGPPGPAVCLKPSHKIVA